MSAKVGKVVTQSGISAIQEQIVKLVPHPHKIVSVLGKIPPAYKKIFQSLEMVSTIPGYVFSSSPQTLRVVDLLVAVLVETDLRL